MTVDSWHGSDTRFLYGQPQRVLTRPGKVFLKIADNSELPIISSITNLKYFSGKLTENEIIDVLSDLKHRIFPRPFERLSNLRDRVGGGLLALK